MIATDESRFGMIFLSEGRNSDKCDVEFDEGWLRKTTERVIQLTSHDRGDHDWYMV